MSTIDLKFFVHKKIHLDSDKHQFFFTHTSTHLIETPITLKLTIDYEDVRNERKILKKLPQHKNIITILWTGKTLNNEYITAYPQYPMDLFTLRETYKKRITLSDIFYIINQTISSIEFLHKHQIIHGDIKQENFVISPDAHVILIDFEFSRSFPSPGKYYYDAIGTKMLEPPEMTKNLGWNHLFDIYCLGLLISEFKPDKTRRTNGIQLNKLANKASAYNITQRTPDITTLRNEFNQLYTNRQPFSFQINYETPPSNDEFKHITIIMDLHQELHIPTGINTTSTL